MMTARPGSTNPGLRILLPLNQATNPATAGQKAATLAILQQRGFRVPGGWVIPASIAAQIADGLIEQEVIGSLSCLPDVPLAVRSSGVAEDGDDASFAGQYESLLNVRGVSALLGAITQVWQSGQAHRARSYASGLGTDDPAPTGILIQPMLSPDIAGVAFSANPVTGDRDEVVINAVAGLGDRLMAGEVDAEAWSVRGQTVSGPGGQTALSVEQARAVAALARAVEAALGAAQDIEWAYEQGELWLLQARPITALPVKPELPPLPPGSWMKETEHFTGIASVLVASIYPPLLEEANRTAMSEIGALVDGLRIIDRGGELYSQAIPPGDRHGPPPPAWVLGILTRVVPDMRARVRRTREMFEQDHIGRIARRWREEWKDDLRTRATALRVVDVTALDDEALERHIQAGRDLLRSGLLAHFRLAGPIVIAAYQLVKLSKELFGWDDHDAITLISATASQSSAPAKALAALAETARERPALRDALLNPNVTVAQVTKLDPEFGARISDYLEQFGFRVLENDIAAPTLYERADLVLGLLRERLAAPDTIERDSARVQQQKREEADALLRNHPEAARRRFAEALERASEMNDIREDKVLYTIYYPVSVLRFAFLEAGRRLARRGLLARPDDVFMCTFDEVTSALSGAVSDRLRRAASQRRAERAWTAAHPGPQILGDPPSLPKTRWLPEPARTLTDALLWFLGRQTPHRSDDIDVITGAAVSPGRYQGPVRIIRGQADFDRLKPGDVLVCPVTTSAWGVLFGAAGALVTDHGGVLSHPSIAAREHGVPAVVGTGDATSRLRDGQMVIVDGSTGRIEVLNDGPVERG